MHFPVHTPFHVSGSACLFLNDMSATNTARSTIGDIQVRKDIY
jgi:hypothetical protein